MEAPQFISHPKPFIFVVRVLIKELSTNRDFNGRVGKRRRKPGETPFWKHVFFECKNNFQKRMAFLFDKHRTG